MSVCVCSSVVFRDIEHYYYGAGSLEVLFFFPTSPGNGWLFFVFACFVSPLFLITRYELITHGQT